MTVSNWAMRWLATMFVALPLSAQSNETPAAGGATPWTFDWLAAWSHPAAVAGFLRPPARGVFEGWIGRPLPFLREAGGRQFSDEAIDRGRTESWARGDPEPSDATGARAAGPREGRPGDIVAPEEPNWERPGDGTSEVPTPEPGLTVAPEPATMALLATGLALLGAVTVARRVRARARR